MRWKLQWPVDHNSGDSTVPIASLVGFGGSAKVLPATPEKPAHSDGPNAPSVWENIFKILQGHAVQAAEANPATGVVKGG